MPPQGRHLCARTATARAWLGALAGALVLSACVGQPAGPPALSSSFNHLAVATTMWTYHASSSVGLPVSVVQVSGSTYLLCDYLNVYRVARTATGYSVTTLARPAVPVWTPAGLDFKGGMLYVANYRGRDVLQLQLEGDQLNLIRQVASPQLHEPENLWAEADGSVVVADHNGNGLLRFRPDGSLQWRVQIGQAHGVTESGGFIYASSLQARTISKVDRSGKVVGVSGSPGAWV